MSARLKTTASLDILDADVGDGRSLLSPPSKGWPRSSLWPIGLRLSLRSSPSTSLPDSPALSSSEVLGDLPRMLLMENGEGLWAGGGLFKS